MTLFYRHYKGHYYQVVGEALDTQDDSIVIVYRTLYPSAYSLFTRPKEVFFSQVRLSDGTIVDRFHPVDYKELPLEARNRVLTMLPLGEDGEEDGKPHEDASPGRKQEEPR